MINLASRLCGSAVDTQVLVDRGLAEAAQGVVPVDALGDRSIKGYDHPMPVFAVISGLASVAAP